MNVTGYRRVYKRQNKKGLFVKYLDANPIQIKDMWLKCDVPSFLICIENPQQYDKHFDLRPTTVVERYVSGDEVLEKEVDISEFSERLYNHFGKVAVHTQLYMSKDRARELGYDWDNGSVYRLYALTSKGLKKKDIYVKKYKNCNDEFKFVDDECQKFLTEVGS